MNNHYLSKKRKRSDSKPKLKENIDMNLLPNLTTPFSIKVQSKQEKLQTASPTPMQSSQCLFFRITHLEMKKEIFSYLTVKEITSLISSIKSKAFESMVLKSTSQIIQERISLKRAKTVSLSHPLQLNYSNNYYDALFNHFPSFSFRKKAKFFLQSKDIEFYLEANNLYFYRDNLLISRYQFSRDYISHIQLIHESTQLIALFCFNTIKLFDYNREEVIDTLPYSGNYLMCCRELDTFVVTSDLVGTIYFHGNQKGERREMNLFINGVEVIDMSESWRVVAYSADPKDSNDIYLISLVTFEKVAMNQCNRNKLLLVSSMSSYRRDWLVSVDCEELAVWNMAQATCEKRIKLGLTSITRVNHLPMIRPDCFAVFTFQKEVGIMEGHLLFTEVRDAQRSFQFSQVKYDQKDGENEVYSICKDNKDGIKLIVITIKRNFLLESKKITKFSYVI